ncbi:hypothetical protein H0H92_000395, partial [Tricholoma furcatifolium]
ARAKKSRGIRHRPTALEEGESSDSSDASHDSDEDAPPRKRAKSRSTAQPPSGTQRAPPADPLARPPATSGAHQPTPTTQPVAPPQLLDSFAQMQQMQQMFNMFQQQFGHMIPGANNPVAGPSNSRRRHEDSEDD